MVMVRTDNELLDWVCDYLNNVPKYEKLRNEIGLGFYYGSEEDYGMDIMQSAITIDAVPIEVKGMNPRYDWEFYEQTACRNESIRYGLTGGTPTQEEIDADRTLPPDCLKKGIPINVLNAEDWYGRWEYSKMAKMMRNKAGLIYVHQGGLITFDYNTLFNEAFLCYLWQKLKHTRRFNNQEKRWEKKGSFNMDKCKDHFIVDVPVELLVESEK